MSANANVGTWLLGSWSLKSDGFPVSTRIFTVCEKASAGIWMVYGLALMVVAVPGVNSWALITAKNPCVVQSGEVAAWLASSATGDVTTHPAEAPAIG